MSCADKNRTDVGQKGHHFQEKKSESEFPVNMPHLQLDLIIELQSFMKFCWTASKELCWQEQDLLMGKKHYNLCNS